MIAEQSQHRLSMQVEQNPMFVGPPAEPPNVIGNVDDYELQSQAASLALPDSDNEDIDGSNILGADPSKFINSN